jgi:hypothetical protein
MHFYCISISIKRCGGLFAATFLFFINATQVYANNLEGRDSLKTKNKRIETCDCAKYQALANKEFEAMQKFNMATVQLEKTQLAFKQNSRNPLRKKVLLPRARHQKKSRQKHTGKKLTAFRAWFRKGVADCPKF